MYGTQIHLLIGTYTMCNYRNAIAD